jgi:sugar/nucleoside kinase (ribokinase family)
MVPGYRGGVTIDLCVLGDFAWDVLIRTNTELLRGGDTFGEVALLPGGSGANVAVWATRCGTATHFIGKIGRDRMGQLAIDDLRAEDLSNDLIESDTNLTGSVAVFVDHTGERSMVSGHGADFYLLPSELPRPTIASARHLHLTAWSFFTDPPRTAARQAATIAKHAGATLSLDPGSFQMISEMGVDQFLSVTTDLGVDIFFPNKEEGAVLTGEEEPDAIAAALGESYPDAMIVLKLDADGALVHRSGVSTPVPPVGPDRLVDATGAGDSFAGAFLARWLGGSPPPDAAAFANRIAAWVIQRPGARPSPGPSWANSFDNADRI